MILNYIIDLAGLAVITYCIVTMIKEHKQENK